MVYIGRIMSVIRFSKINNNSNSKKKKKRVKPRSNSY